MSAANTAEARPADANPEDGRVGNADNQVRKMIKADIVNRVAEVSNVPRTKAALAVETIFETMKNALRDGKRIELRGFGVFQVRDRKKGVGRNPKTGVEVAITPGKTVRFKPGKELRDI